MYLAQQLKCLKVTLIVGQLLGLRKGGLNVC
jgi:hypothetical protein